ncbi:uncharacterized protein TRIVIDRAFT_63983 [Trichoderma virens Gv29-8]|uniref:C2H2-type domain-containing protein n=1 Tax=Hypocrea virens (strain Gv29-8 / FGSC 10586) TaxID=413071 RepID=G9MNY3_HYPVG|nr:uncharacterized protein TRIVIDRAFT_63983 [Trichoderma virens Gv29-8]EHK23585.1 hypothetical protein TRIVIDRAFT_63983 [Trichoderma virens Gv29-8]
MLLRCKRILYQRSHFDKFLGKAGNPSIPVALTAEIGDHGDIPFPPAPCGNIMRKYNKLKKQRGEEYNIDQENEHADLTASQEYRDILKNDWNEIVEAAREVDCPFCCSTLPARDAVDDNKWKLHVQNDIDPYVCLFEGCESPEELYNHSTWLKHMSSHYMQWRCISKAHIEFRSATKSEYINHMKDVHPDKFTNAQLNIIANRNARPISSMFKPCPLCGIEVVDGNKSDHVARHLLHLALKSLPSYEENIEKHENLEYQKNDISISSARRENAIRLDEQIHVYHDTGAYATASVREQMPKDYNYSMKRFLGHSEIPEGRSLLCFGEAESVEKAKDRARIRLNDFNAQFGSSINPPSETEAYISLVLDGSLEDDVGMLSQQQPKSYL